MINNQMRKILNRGGVELESKLRILFQSLPFQLCELFVLDNNSEDDKTSTFHCRYFYLRGLEVENLLYGASHSNEKLNTIDSSDKAGWSTLHTIFEALAFPIPNIWAPDQLSFSIYNEALYKSTKTNFHFLQEEYNNFLIADPIRKVTGLRDLTIVRVPEADGRVAGAVRLFNQFGKNFSATNYNSLAYAALVYGRWIELFTNDSSDELETLPDINRGPQDFEIRSRSPRFKKLFPVISSAAKSNIPVLILGKSGTGKEHIARYIHRNNKGKDAPFIPVNCASISSTMFEREFFGHKRGSFTGAESDSIGLLSAAKGGTIFLDEIGHLSPELQPKLLRVIRDYEFIPIGSQTVEKLEARILSATSKNLEEEAKNGGFLEELFYRLNVLPISLPTLRERSEDIPDLIDATIDYLKISTSDKIPEFPFEVKRILAERKWPGNIGELSNVVKRFVALYYDFNIIPLQAVLDVGGGYDFTDITSSMRVILTFAREAKISGTFNGKDIFDIIKTITIGVTTEIEGDMSKAARTLNINLGTVRKFTREFKNLTNSLKMESEK